MKPSKKPEDIAGKVVGGGKASAQLDQLKAFTETLPGKADVREYPGNNEAYADLAAGRIVAVGNSLPNIAFVAKQRPDTFEVVQPPFGTKSYFGYPGLKDDDHKSLMDAIEAAMLKIKADGRLATIQEKWFGAKFETPDLVNESGALTDCRQDRAALAERSARRSNSTLSTRQPRRVTAAAMSWKLFELLIQAALYTVLISFVSIAIGLAIGMMVSAATLSPKPRPGPLPGRTFVSFFRGVPLLVQLLLIYNLLPALGLDVPSIVAAITGLSLCTAAYQAENLRGGFQSVPRGLLEAADMAGLSACQQFWRIRAPIALSAGVPLAGQRSDHDPEGIVAGFGRRHRRADAHGAGSCSEHLSADRAVCRGRPALPHHQLADRLRRRAVRTLVSLGAAMNFDTKSDRQQPARNFRAHSA